MKPEQWKINNHETEKELNMESEIKYYKFIVLVSYKSQKEILSKLQEADIDVIERLKPDVGSTYKMVVSCSGADEDSAKQYIENCLKNNNEVKICSDNNTLTIISLWITCEKCNKQSNKLIEEDTPIYKFECTDCKDKSLRYKVECKGLYDGKCDQNCDDECDKENHYDQQCKKVFYISFDKYYGECSKCQTDFEMIDICSNYNPTEPRLTCECNQEGIIIQTENNNFLCTDCGCSYYGDAITNCRNCNAPQLGQVQNDSEIQGCNICMGTDGRMK